MGLFCKIHDLVVHGASSVQSRWSGAPEGGIVKNASPLSPLFATKKIVLDKPNAFEGSKMMCKFSSFRCHLEVSILTRFGFSVIIGNYVHIFHIMGTANLIG